jgi:hypothetical protein
VQTFNRARGGGHPRWMDPAGLCPAARLLSRAGKGAQEGNKPGVGLIRRSVPCNGVVWDSESALVVRLVQAHVDPNAVLLVPRLGDAGALLLEGVGDLVVDVLLLYHAFIGWRAAHDS